MTGLAELLSKSIGQFIGRSGQLHPVTTNYNLTSAPAWSKLVTSSPNKSPAALETMRLAVHQRVNTVAGVQRNDRTTLSFLVGRIHADVDNIVMHVGFWR